jgi:hypothetical protein
MAEEIDPRYQQHAHEVDDVFTKCLAILQANTPDMAPATIMGALSALIRFQIQETALRGQPLITRDIVSALVPPIHQLAEQQVTAARERAKVDNPN